MLLVERLANKTFNFSASCFCSFFSIALFSALKKSSVAIGYFDPVSHLAYAETRTVEKGGDGFTNQTKTTKGYINEKGEWVILQKQESTW